MLIWAPLIKATRWDYSRQSLLSAGVVDRLHIHLVAGIRGTLIGITVIGNVHHLFTTQSLLWHMYAGSVSMSVYRRPQP